MNGSFYEWPISVALTVTILLVSRFQMSSGVSVVSFIFGSSAGDRGCRVICTHFFSVSSHIRELSPLITLAEYVHTVRE